MSKELQKDLILLGYGSLVGALDGIAGKKTRDAVEALQADAGLVVDGIAGVKTLAAIKFRKSAAGRIGTVNFNVSEFDSPDVNRGPANGMHNELLLNLEYLRWVLGGKSIRINSGYRTAEFNKKVGGYRYSNHLTGRAADIKVEGVSPSKVQNVAAALFNGLGRYKNFTHVDTDEQKVHFTGKY